jgi:NAD(P)H-hydrate epimerase
MSAEASLRAGAGLVTLGVPASLNDILEVKLTEAMTLPLPEVATARAVGAAAWTPIVEFLNEKSEKSTVALGPGIGTHPETRELVARLVRDLACPMVIDADGINNLAGATAGLKDAAGPRILTPHPGEMARLVGLTTPEVQARRLDLARETAAKFGVTLVLKGAQTVVAAPDGRASINSTGNPALASGGTGDVLTGLIGGFLAQGLAPWDAARLGVYLHGLAADYFISRHGQRGMIAGDLLAVWPQMLAEFSQGTIPLAEGDICFTRVIS